jgi:hypothetical protein
LQRKAFLGDERQRGHLARIGCILYDYQSENIDSESDQWTSEPIFQCLPLPDVLSQAGSHGEIPGCGLNHLGHSDTELNGVGPGFSEETFSTCNSRLGTHNTDDFGQETWEISSSREYSWSSPLPVPYSMFGEASSQCCGSNSHSSSQGRWDQKHMDESDCQSIKIESLSGLDGLDLSSFCGNWADEPLSLGQRYEDPTENSAISPESLERFQNPLEGYLGPPADLAFPTSVNVGEVTTGIVGEILPPASHHGSNASFQSPCSSQEAVLATSDSCPSGHVRICPRPEQPPRNPPRKPYRPDDQVSSVSKPEAQPPQKRQPRCQTSSRSLAPRPIHPKLPSNERNWRSSSPDSRSAPTRYASPRGRTSPSARAAQRKIMKDQFLIESKLAGMSYREIREKGNFSEAESTLRGRFRTLTKEKGKRVRKPEWEDEDVVPNVPSSTAVAEADSYPSRFVSSSEQWKTCPLAQTALKHLVCRTRASRYRGSRLLNTLPSMEARIILETRLAGRNGMRLGIAV